MRIEPIGRVEKLPEGESVIEIAPACCDGLHGIGAGDRLQVLYWMHKLESDERKVLKVHPRGDRSRPLKGVFAVRSPMRPNPIGVTTVEVMRVEGNRVFVKSLDALGGSPVIDIKGSA